MIYSFERLSVPSSTQYDGVVNYRFTNNADKLVYHPTNNPLGIVKARVAASELSAKNLEFKKSLAM